MEYFLLTKSRTAKRSMPRSTPFSLGVRIVLVFVFVLNVGVQANGLAQKINIHFQNETIENVFSSIKAQTTYSFLYKEHAFDAAPRVSGTFNNNEVKEVLDEVLKENGYDYKIISGTVTIAKKDANPRAVASLVHLEQEKIQIIGRVTDSSGSPYQELPW